MTIRNLDALFAPRSVAVVGASNRPHSVGAVVTRNLLRGGFEGAVMPVNPHEAAVAGVLAYPDVASLPRVADLGVVATPPETVPAIVEALGRAGTRAVVVLTAGLKQPGQPDLEAATLAAARRHGTRILGPNCVGLLVPGIGLDASFAHVPAAPGRLAFVSQSGALCTAVLDWARSHGVGFSCFVSLGNSIDVDVGDVLDYLSGDAGTGAVLLYVEGLVEARKFMSAGRAAARNKPVIVIKSGRLLEAARAAASHTGALAAADDVVDAAIRRAGMLRVERIADLFAAAETLARAHPLWGRELLIVTNGGGPGVMATDALLAGGGRLAAVSPATRAKLDAVLPQTWSGANPVDLVGDATHRRYGDAIHALRDDASDAGLLVLHAPTALVSGEEAAKAVAEALSGAPPRGVVLTSWLGGGGAEPARRILREAGLPTYDTPEDAVRAFLQMVAHRENQDQLLETPSRSVVSAPPDASTARAVLTRALNQEREWLSQAEAMSVLEAYGIPAVDTRIADDAAHAVRLARELGFPVALKILSPDVLHKSELGGVALDLEDAGGVEAAAEVMVRRLRSERPDARLEGFVVQRMERRRGALELIAGATTDPIFGPVLLFGQGGTAVEVLADRALALPPLNVNLARDLVRRTRVARLLDGYRDRPPIDHAALSETLVRICQLVVDLSEIREIDVNPLLADERGVVALDARIRIGPPGERVPLAIRPYPAELEEKLTLPGREVVTARPIRPEDEPAHRAFFERLDRDDVYFRFFNMVREMPHSQLARYTQIDYDREMAFIAYRSGTPDETLGVVRAVTDPDNERAEFAVIVRSDFKGKGLGKALLLKLIHYCRARGTRRLAGQVLDNNRAMLGLAHDLGFEVAGESGGVVDVGLALQET